MAHPSVVCLMPVKKRSSPSAARLTRSESPIGRSVVAPYLEPDAVGGRIDRGQLLQDEA